MTFFCHFYFTTHSPTSDAYLVLPAPVGGGREEIWRKSPTTTAGGSMPCYLPTFDGEVGEIACCSLPPVQWSAIPFFLPVFSHLFWKNFTLPFTTTLLTYNFSIDFTCHSTHHFVATPPCSAFSSLPPPLFYLGESPPHACCLHLPCLQCHLTPFPTVPCCLAHSSATIVVPLQ